MFQSIDSFGTEERFGDFEADLQGSYNFTDQNYNIPNFSFTYQAPQHSETAKSQVQQKVEISDTNSSSDDERQRRFKDCY